jgi:transposase InsO family protein
VKYAWIEGQSDHYAVSRICRVLGVSRTGYLQWLRRPASPRQRRNEELGAQLRVIHAENGGAYGRPRLWRALVEHGQRVSQERVRRLMAVHGLRSVYKRADRKTTQSAHDKPVAANLVNRQLGTQRSDRIWMADISYVATAEGWLYLAAVLDLGSRRLVGWSMSARMPAKLVCDALAMAYFRRRPRPGLIAHSDRGGQYASEAYRRDLAKYRMQQNLRLCQPARLQ